MMNKTVLCLMVAVSGLMAKQSDAQPEIQGLLNDDGDRVSSSALVSSPTISISEFMAVNSYVPFVNALDIYTRYDWKPSLKVHPDWIELYNNSPAPINLAGWYLTDDPANKTKWQFPSDMGSELVLGPGAYFVLFASNKEQALFPNNYPYVDYDGALHTNFKLGAQDGYLAIIAPDGVTVSHKYNDYPEQLPFTSYGIAQDASQGYLTPTPGIRVHNKWTGAANSAGVSGKVSDTRFSHTRGFYDSAFDVILSCDTAGVDIHYTLDGSEPQLTVGGSSQRYSGPVHISKTTCLRAKAFKAGLLASNVGTQTYLFLSDVVKQSQPNDARYVSQWGGYPADYGMEDDTSDIKRVAGDSNYTVDEARAVISAALEQIPTLSVTTDPNNLFKASIGIYTNTRKSGDLWERPVSAEYFSLDPNDDFQIDCGLRLQGGASRIPVKAPKHSLSLRFRGGYGQSQLKTDIFREQTAVDEFDGLHLRAMYNNSWIHWDSSQRARGTMIRDQFIRDCLIAMGQESTGAGTYVHLYLNGLYWGVYNMHERQDASHYAAYYGGDSEYYDARNAGEIVDGDSDQWNNLQAAVSNANPSSQTDWEDITAVLDVENYIDYTIIEQYGRNVDLRGVNNWRAAGGGVFGALWQFYSWDSERTFESGTVSTPSSFLSSPFLLGDLRNFEEFRIQFADRVYKHFRNQGALTYTSASALFNGRAVELEDAIIAESARWGDYRRDVHQYSNGPYELYTKTDFWLPELVDIDSYLLAKETNAIYHFKSLSPPLYPFIEPPVFKIDSVEQSGGYVTIPCTFDMLSDNYGIDEIHYTLDGTDPREYWTGDVCQTATLYDGMPIELNTTMTVKARTKIGPCWSALHEALYVDDSICDSLRITEIMYHPVDADAEFLELKNIGLNTINLNGVQFTQGIEHTFGDVTVDPNGYVLIVRDKSAFEAYYTSIPENAPVIQWDSGALANSQEEIKWNNGLGQTIQLFTYQDKWYDQTDGQGFSLTIRDPLGATYLWDQKNGWRSSLYVGGSPGQTEDIQ